MVDRGIKPRCDFFLSQEKSRKSLTVNATTVLIIKITVVGKYCHILISSLQPSCPLLVLRSMYKHLGISPPPAYIPPTHNWKSLGKSPVRLATLLAGSIKDTFLSVCACVWWKSTSSFTQRQKVDRKPLTIFTLLSRQSFLMNPVTVKLAEQRAYSYLYLSNAGIHRASFYMSVADGTQVFMFVQQTL